MSDVTIDGRNYDLDSLPDAARDQLASVQFVDTEITRVQAMLAALHTARNAYASALNAELSKLDAFNGGTVRVQQ